ncbi:unnamed protein product [Closterium sp. Yama58-4]|nr:unnamed protein product [Closterium sp. Yama58-4]
MPFPSLPTPGQGGGPVTVQPTAAQTLVKGRAAVASTATASRAAATAAGDAGDGFAFVTSVSSSATGGSSGSSNGTGGGGSLGYAGMDKRSIAVEFDTARSIDANDPDKSHVGVSVRGNTSSIATIKAPFTLNDSNPKHAWIVFDPSPSSSSATAGDGYDSSSSSIGTGAAKTSFLMGFSASSSDSPQQHSILTWNITTGDCWAYAVVGSVEMAYSILFNLSAVPLLSVSQLRDALGASCSQGNSPSQAFQYLVTLNAKSKVGLMEDGAEVVVRGKRGKKHSQSPFCGMPVFALLLQALGIACGKGRTPGSVCKIS